MRRFNARTLMYRSTPMRTGAHLCKAGQMLAWTRMLSERLGTWREPMARKHRAERRRVWRMDCYATAAARGVEIDQREEA